MAGKTVHIVGGPLGGRMKERHEGDRIYFTYRSDSGSGPPSFYNVTKIDFPGAEPFYIATLGTMTPRQAVQTMWAVYRQSKLHGERDG